MPSPYGFPIFLTNTTILSISNLMNPQIIFDMLLSFMPCILPIPKCFCFVYRFSSIFPEVTTPFQIIATSLFPPPNFYSSSLITTGSFFSAQISSFIAPISFQDLVPYYSKLYPHSQTMKLFVFCQVVPENHLFYKSTSHYINGNCLKAKELESWHGLII